MGLYDGRHGAVGIFLTTEDPFKISNSRELLGEYDWADTVFFHNFTSWSGIESYEPQYIAHLGSKLIMSNGIHYASGLPAGQNKMFITNRADLENIVPINSDSVLDPVANESNRGENTTVSVGTWDLNDSLTFIVNVSTPGIAGVAKADVYAPDGLKLSSNNVINQNQTIICSGNVGIQFQDSGPFFLNDTWAVRGIKSGSTRIVVDVELEGTGYIEKVVMKLTGTGDQTSSLDAEDSGTIIVTPDKFGESLYYPNDFGSVQLGSNLHVALVLNKDNVDDYLLVKSLNIALGDAQEYSAWP